jgi:hypothetical protein
VRRDACFLGPNRGDQSLAHLAAHVAGIVDLRVDDPRGAHDLLELTAEAEFRALLVAPAPAVLAADAHVHLADRHRPTRRAEQPALDELGFGVRVVHERSRRIERARDDDVAVVGQGDRALVLLCHRSS